MTIKHAAEKAMHLGKQLQAVIEVGKVLDEIGDLENARQEAERDTKQAESDRCDAGVELAETKQAIVTAEIDFKTIKLVAKDYKDESTARCNLILANARKERDKIVLAATRGSEERISKATTEVHNLHNKRDDLLKEITTVESRLHNLEDQMRGLRERLG